MHSSKLPKTMIVRSLNGHNGAVYEVNDNAHGHGCTTHTTSKTDHQVSSSRCYSQLLKKTACLSHVLPQSYPNEIWLTYIYVVHKSSSMQYMCVNRKEWCQCTPVEWGYKLQRRPRQSKAKVELWGST